MFKPRVAVGTWGGRSRPPVSQMLLRQGRAVADDLRNVPRYALRALVGVAAVCGLAGLWAAHGDGKLPGMLPLCGLDPYRISSADCVEPATTADARWQGLAPALAILDRVNPEVARWLRQKHRDGLVLFGEELLPGRADPMMALAKYDMFRGRIVVMRELFCENDGTVAVILCHEYRHSRQNLGKFCQYVLSFLFVADGDSSIIENDALNYEHEAHNAIFGDGLSREKQLAAWAHSAQARGAKSETGR
jgi:hypothetical protein